jgi:hypothetical protein
LLTSPGEAPVFLTPLAMLELAPRHTFGGGAGAVAVAAPQEKRLPTNGGVF